MPVVALTPAQIQAGLRSGFRLSNAQFTFSIPGVGSTWETTAGNYTGSNLQPFQNYSTLSTSQAAAFRAAIALWDKLIANNFIEVADDGSGHGEIRVAFTSNGMDAGTAGYAFQGSNQTPTSIIGDVWLNNSTTSQNFASGTDNFMTLVHEIGHTLGLKHPFEGSTIPSPYEDQRYTVMSYTTAKPYFSRGFAATQSGGITTTTTRAIVTTPMVIDIAAVQSIYGADLTTAVGNNTYTFDQNSTAIQAIYDAGGIDTFDLSTSTRNNIIDIRPGAYSSIGYWTIAEQIAYWQALYPGNSNFIANQLNNGDTANGGPWYEWKDNVGIAFSTTIENVIGGSGNDTIIGNDVANTFYLQRGGNDNVSGGDGNDGFYFGAAFTAADVVDGGVGTLDQVALQGNYATALTLSATSLVNVENVVLLTGGNASFGDTANNNYSYNLILNDANIAAGQTLYFSANTLRAGENFTLNASAETNGIVVTYGGFGIDTVIGGAGNDGFYFGPNRWGANDRVDGGAGALDQVAIQGNYSGGQAITFGATQIVNVENLVLLSANDQRFGNGGASFSYTLTMNDANVVGAQLFAISANTLAANEVLTLNASAETGSAYTVYSGAGADTIVTGAGNDLIYGGGGADQLTGGAGNDTYAYRQIGDSTAAASDQINGFTTGDKIDLGLIDANTTTAGTQQFVLGFGGTPSAAGDLRVTNLGGNLYQIAGEVDNVVGVDFRILVTSDHALTLADFNGVVSSFAAVDPVAPVTLGEIVAPAPETLADAVMDSHPGGLAGPVTPVDVAAASEAGASEAGAPLAASLFTADAVSAPADLSATAFGHDRGVAEHGALLFDTYLPPVQEASPALV